MEVGAGRSLLVDLDQPSEDIRLGESLRMVGAVLADLAQGPRSSRLQVVLCLIQQRILALEGGGGREKERAEIRTRGENSNVRK